MSGDGRKTWEVPVGFHVPVASVFAKVFTGLQLALPEQVEESHTEEHNSLVLHLMFKPLM